MSHPPVTMSDDIDAITISSITRQIRQNAAPIPLAAPSMRIFPFRVSRARDRIKHGSLEPSDCRPAQLVFSARAGHLISALVHHVIPYPAFLPYRPKLGTLYARTQYVRTLYCCRHLRPCHKPCRFTARVLQSVPALVRTRQPSPTRPAAVRRASSVQCPDSTARHVAGRMPPGPARTPSRREHLRSCP